MNKIKAAEERYPDSDGNDLKSALKDNFNLMKRHAFIAGWDARDALSTQSPKWVKCVDKEPEPGVEILFIDHDRCPIFGRFSIVGKFKYVITLDSSGEEDYQLYSTFEEYLDEVATHPLQEKIDNELQRLYDWLMDEKRKPAQTFFTSGALRNVAKEIEFRLHKASVAQYSKSDDATIIIHNNESPRNL